MYKAIIFDLDNTLLNFSLCETESMRRTCNDHNLFIDDIIEWDLFWKSFSEHNFRHWMDFVNGGKVRTIGDVLRFSFRDTLDREELFHSKLSDTYWEYFCNTCIFEDGAEQILSIFKDKYPLGIITNGISESQRKRLKAGKIDEMFKSIVISDEVGIRKPRREIFEIALNDLELSNSEVLFVGDSLQDDYHGAMNSGIDFCFYNRQNIEVSKDINTKYNIRNLLDLVNVLGM
ncbi:putative hydrolase of the HAD superfamily [Paenibacillus sp. yr247]|uniref:HAD family hydrolase n=1 Tax=Paenibacillus sp. yr247 TaxID=1761880 RepID=UPI000880BEE8|nr:HAD-IA family hydrolase [Paenibacillus sp. yr247]SDP27064.1 putative hydrolase of the HAD superfamily [Paenibacillus sp. yr247]